jgi:electron transfer flavoprotein alpha/beta subunit
MQQKKIAVPSEISIKKLLDNGKKEVQKWSDDWKIS